MARSIYIDCEWYIGGDLFLVGYAYSARNYGQIHGSKLTKNNFLKLLKGVQYIFFYGPDIGVIERYWNVSLRSEFTCMNLIKVFRHHFHARSYKLADIEKMFGIYRAEAEYKKNVFQIWRDWANPHRKARLLRYNLEDVLNMMKLWKIVRFEFQITNDYLNQEKLK